MTIKTESPLITIRDLVNGYYDGGDDNRVSAYGGKLNIRPAFQRQFVYTPDKRDKVLQSVYNNLPLNSMYWAVNDDGSYEVVDGQQRIISICQFITNNDGDGNPIAINFNGKNSQCFTNLSPEKQQEILDYKLNVYLCKGSYDDKLEWFHTINIAGEIMREQELRNADYTGLWLTDAKSYFSKKKQNPAMNISFYDNDDKHSLISFDAENINRQSLLELVLRWIINTDSIEYPRIEDYMAKHCSDNDATELKEYFKSVMVWVMSIFKKYNKDMKGLEWGILYNKYNNKSYDVKKIQNKLDELYKIYDEDPDGLKKSGFYEYVLSEDRSLIWHRVFSEKQQRQAYRNQNGKCPHCSRKYDFKEMEAHHKVPFSKGGDTVIDNCLMLCHNCHADITAKQNQTKKKRI